MKNKKILAVMLSITLALTAIACGNTTKNTTDATSVSASMENTAEESSSDENASSEENKDVNDEETSISDVKEEESSVSEENNSQSVTEVKGLGLTKNDEAFSLCEKEYEETVAKILNLVASEADLTYIPGMYGLSESAIFCSADEFDDTLGYTFLDLDGDGDYELLIGEVGDDRIRACYTDHDFFVFEGWARNTRCIIPTTADGKETYTIYNMGSGGAASTSYGLFTLNSQSNKLDCEEFYFTETKDDGQTGVFTNKSGIFDANFADEIDMAEEDVHDMGRKWEEETVAINFTPLADYSFTQENNAGNEDAAALKASYLFASVNLADIRFASFEDNMVGGYRTVIADTGEQAANVIITPLMDLEDVSFINCKNLDADESGEGLSFEKESIDKKMIFKEGQPIMVTMTFYGDIPNYGFIGKSGDQKYLAMLGLSGEDGSPMLSVYGIN